MDEYEEVDGVSKLVGQKLQQIVFWCEEGVRLMQRFCVGHLLMVDATFNTNSHRLPLMTSMGWTNEQTRLPGPYSYCPGEDKDSYAFFLDVVANDIFEGGKCTPAVILGDQSKGLIAAVNAGGLDANQRLQHCNWHAQSAMITRFRKGGYISTEIEVLQDLS